MRRFVLCLVFVCGVGVVQASPLRYQVVPGKSNVTFTSAAPLVTVVGKTTRIHGGLTGDRGSIVVDLASLHTGNAMRDKKMRRDFLETTQFPTVQFTLQRLTQGQATGTMHLHGVQRIITVPVQIETRDDTMTVITHFPLRLSDYHIHRPKLLLMKLSDTIAISARILLQHN